MIETFIKFWPKDVTLYAYWEEQEPEIFADNVKYVNLLESQPELVKFVKRNKDDPKKNGWREDRQKWVWKNDGVKFSYKVFAQTHRLKNTTSDRILYLDADTFTFDTPDMNYIDEILPEDNLCSFLGREKHYDETGYYFHNSAHPKAKAWANRLEEIYIKDELWGLAQQVDCYTMYWGRQSFLDCKQFDLNAYHGGFGKSHPFVNTKLGTFLDHLKGFARKEQGHSKTTDFKGKGLDNLKHDYWKTRQNG